MSLRLNPASLRKKSIHSVSILSLLVLAVLYGVPLTTKVLSSASVLQRGTIRERIRQRIEEKNDRPAAETSKIAGLNVVIWKPSQRAAGKAPLIVFSHGFHGCNTQSTFLMQALADAGYLVVAPNHKDAGCVSGLRGRPEEGFARASAWDSGTYQDRRDDLNGLIDAMRRDSAWSSQIDWAQVGLAGHSLGGYTVLGLAGGWPNWRMSNVKAVLALSPYCEPYALKGDLGGIRIPVMYQGGTRDIGITPSVKKQGGCFAKTSSPAIFVEFNRAGHFAWTDFLNTDHELIEQYSLAFLDKYVRGKAGDDPTVKRPGVTDLKVK